MAKRTPPPPTILDITSARDPRKENKPKITTKVCANCGEQRPLNEYYANKSYVQGLMKDRWCKKCAKEKCVDEVSFREYLMLNNRHYPKEMWAEALEKALKDCNTSSEYVEAAPEAKEKMLNRRAALVGLLLMNEGRFYRYVNYEARDFNYDVSGEVLIEKAQERDSADPYYADPVYSPAWNGSYTQYEIDKMDAYYKNIIKVRGIEDTIGENYCRQFVKQSAIVDDLAEKYRKDPSKENDQQYKNAISSLEALSQAAQLAPRYRKADATIGLGSLGEFIKAAEDNNLLTHPQTFPPDDIDGIIANLRHIGAAVQGAGGLWTNDTSQAGVV